MAKFNTEFNINTSSLSTNFNVENQLINTDLENYIYITNDGKYNFPVATDKVLGGIIVGQNLKINDLGVLSVDTIDDVEQDNTKPITSNAVYTTVGNINALLEQI